MILSRTSLVLVAAASAALLVAAPARAQALRLADSTFAVRADSLVGGVKLRLHNAGDSLVVTGAAIDSVHLTAGAGAPGLTVTSRSLGIPRNGVAELSVRGDSAWLAQKPGRYLATLRLATRSGTVRLPLVVMLSAPPPAASVTPLVSKQKVRLTGRSPFGRFSGEVQVPLHGDAAAPAATSSPLVHGDRELAFARPGAAVRWEEDGTFNAYPIEVSRLRGGRTYTGPVQLTAGDPATTVELTVEASDWIVWVLLVVVLGVAAGIALRRWNEVGRLMSVLREREMRLGARFEAAFARYAGAGGAKDALNGAVEARRKALRQKLATTRFLLRKDEAEFQALQKEIEELEAAADRIERLATTQMQLKSASGELKQSLGDVVRPPADEGIISHQLRGLDAADEMLSGAGVTLDTMEIAAQARTAQADFLKRLGSVYHEWAQKNAWLQDLQTDVEERRLDDAKENLATVLWAVWAAPDAVAFDTRKPEDLLTAVEDDLRKIAADRAERARMKGEPLQDGAAAGLAGAGKARLGWIARAGAAADTGVPVAVQTERAEYERRMRALNDLAAGVASFIAALIGMLLSKYFNHPFGTASDYAAAFTWGFGATAGFDLLAFGLASLQPVLTRVTTRVTTP